MCNTRQQRLFHKTSKQIKQGLQKQQLKDTQKKKHKRTENSNNHINKTKIRQHQENIS
jgi:hypothetical protein